jgi:Zn-dependent protease
MTVAVAYETPLFWALFIAWIMSVVVHEFAHGIVAHWGGDYTIKERGGLTLNPLQYIDPFTSILLPGLFLLMGGVPLPGGVTYVRRDLLRNRAWDAAVSAAGPLSNLVLFFACAIPLHPAVGWVDPAAGLEGWSNAQKLLGALCVLQFMAVVINLIPVPPLDGFQIVAAFMDPATREKLMTPPVSTFAFVGLFLVLSGAGLGRHIFQWTNRVLVAIGFDYEHLEMVRQSFNLTLFGRTD